MKNQLRYEAAMAAATATYGAVMALENFVLASLVVGGTSATTTGAFALVLGAIILPILPALAAWSAADSALLYVEKVMNPTPDPSKEKTQG